MAGVGAVQDVVVHQRREVDQLDDPSSANERFRRRATSAGAEGQQRTKPFAGVGENFADHWPHLWFKYGFLGSEEFLERLEVVFQTCVQRGGHAAMCE